MKILLAYDGFEYSRHALEEAAKMAAEEDSTVTVVSVVPPERSRHEVGRPRRSAPACGGGHHARPCLSRLKRGIDAGTKIR